MSQLNQPWMFALAIGLATSKTAFPEEPMPNGMLRLSILGDKAFAPTEIGNLVKKDYQAEKNVGQLGRIRFFHLGTSGIELPYLR